MNATLAPGYAATQGTHLGFGGHWAAPTALFLFLVICLRLGSFGYSVLDPDESLYILMAQGILDGRTPYVDIWDHKPPGIYYLFAATHLVFGSSIAAIRLVACLAVAASCVLLVAFGRDRLHSAPVGYIAGLLYAVFSLTNDGLAANTEIFFTPWVIGGLYLVTAGSASAAGTGDRRGLFAAGLCFGIGLQIKYIIVFEVALAFALVLVRWRRRGASWRDLAYSMAPLVAGIVLPAAIVVAHFAAAGALAEYWHANVVANAIHSSNTPWSLTAAAQAAVVQLRANLLLWCGVAASLLWLVTDGGRQSDLRRQLLVLLAWLCGAGLGVCVTRRFYPHYSLQMLPALSLVTAFVCWHGLGTALRLRHRAVPLLLMLAPGIVPVLAAPIRNAAAVARTVQLNTPMRSDEPARIAHYLNEQMRPDDSLYVADYQPVLYFLVHARRPTRYLFPQFLTSNHFSRVAGIDPLRELESIFTDRAPQYVVVAAERNSSVRFAEALAVYLTRDYTRDRMFASAIVYRRKPSP